MNLMEFIRTRKITILDGAMGTELDKVGLMSRGRNNLDNSDAVVRIHREYIDSGCHAIITNTLTMNRIYVETHDVNVDIRDVNAAGVRLAREAAGADVFVLGDVSSTGQLLDPYGDYSDQQFYNSFKEQSEILAGNGVDAFIIESIFDLREALCALRACRASSRIPAIVSIMISTTSDGGRTIMGDAAKDCAVRLTDAGADAIGANCGDITPHQMAEVVYAMRSVTSLPIVAQPNAGRPQLINGVTVFDMEPDDFAEGIAACIDAGASIVGGCCGTSPAHISAISRQASLPDKHAR